MKKALLILVTFFAFFNLYAQDIEKWTLKKCVEYAMKNNISVIQADIQARISELQAKQAKLYQYPSATFGTSISPQFGRTIDRTTNVFANTEIITQNIALQGSIEIFNWGKQKNNIASAQFLAKAALADIDKSANDIALNVTTFFLQAIAAYQQIEISKVQILQTKNNLEATRKRVDGGALPELNALEFESQLATDSSNLVLSETNYTQALLGIKGLLNLDAALPFDIDIPKIENIPLENIVDLDPNLVYKLALESQPAIKANRLRILGSEKGVLASKAALNPSISASYYLGTNYANKAQEVTSITTKPVIIGNVNVAGNNYDVFSESYQFNFSNSKYFSQLNNNFGQSFSLNISVPIFNYGINKTNYQQSKLNLETAKITETQIEQKLKQDIYTAHSNALNALQKLNASKKLVYVSQKTFNIASKRFEVGLLNSIELITNQNNFLRAKTQLLADEFDYIFKMKLLEFYKGKGLKL